ncbi:hypothetical protein KR032_001077 [Drosophila birchii]|nr:hypothetical protein KR032_001077 [Drosophila birchii]
MDRSNIRESRSYVENEANLHTMKTIHSLDAMYKTYVPPTIPKNDKPAPTSQPQPAPTPILKPSNTENLIKPNYIRPLARNLAPLVCANPYQPYGIYPPRVQFSYIPCFTDPGPNQGLLNPQVSALRIASGQMNRRLGNSFDSTGNGSSPHVPPNNVTFAEPQSFYSQKGYYGNPSYSGFGCTDSLDCYRQQYLSDQGIGSHYGQQSSPGPGGCGRSASRECTKRYQVNDNCFDNTYHEEGKSMCSSDEKKSSDPQISDDCTPTSSDGCTAAASAYPLSAICTKEKDSCCSKCYDHVGTRNFNCSPRPSCGSLKPKGRRVRIASDSFSKCSQDSPRSTSSRNSICSGINTSGSDRGLRMPDPEALMLCEEPENNCNGPSGSCSQAKLTCPPMICWDGCNVGNNNTAVGNCSMNSTYLNGCYLNDQLQDCTVYNRDYKPIMCVCNHLYQHYAGCCWQDLPLGGGCGPCGACGSCGGFGALSNLPYCYPFPFDGNRYVPPSATLDTCSRPFCDHYAEDPTKCNSHLNRIASICPLASAIEGCCSLTDCLPPQQPPSSCCN